MIDHERADVLCRTDCIPLAGRPWRAVERAGRYLIVPHGWPRPTHLLEANPYRPEAAGIAATVAHLVNEHPSVVGILRTLLREVDDVLTRPGADSAKRLRAASAAAHRLLDAMPLVGG